jgi:hypothetical protein
VEEAMRFAVLVQEAERQENFNDKFYTRHERTTYSDSDKLRHAVGTRTASQAEGRRKEILQSATGQ